MFDDSWSLREDKTNHVPIPIYLQACYVGMLCEPLQNRKKCLVLKIRFDVCDVVTLNRQENMQRP